MTKLAYLECPTGLAGDMFLGALVHAGVPLEYLTEKLSLLEITDEYQLWAELVHRNGQQATKVHVDLAVASASEHGPHPITVHQSDPSKSLPVHSQPQHSGTKHHTHVHSHELKHGHQHDKSDRHRDAHNSHTQNNHEHNSHEHAHNNRYLPEIEKLITSAQLPARVEAWSLAIFRRLAEAEGAVHGISPEQVHFHEVGATDAIVDIVGTCLGLDWLKIDKLYCSPLPVGGGTVRAAHGLLPVPAPAVLKLLEMRQVPIYSNGINRELVTPTGAAIVTTLATQFGSPPSMTLYRIGLGAGSRDLAIPNILRLWLGMGDQGCSVGDASQTGIRDAASGTLHEREVIQKSTLSEALETIAVLETQIDDLNPQAMGYVFEVLFAAGALDVFTQAIGMKKSRPGILLTVICYPEQVADCESVIFRETTTLGIRRTQQQRAVLYRDIQVVQTTYGTVRIKVARQEPDGAIMNVQPEYEDCAALARQFNLPWREIHQLTLRAWYDSNLQEHDN